MIIAVDIMINVLCFFAGVIVGVKVIGGSALQRMYDRGVADATARGKGLSRRLVQKAEAIAKAKGKR